MKANTPTTPPLKKDELIALIKTTPTQAYFKEYIVGGFLTRVIFGKAVLFEAVCCDILISFLMSEDDFKDLYKSEREINATLLFRYIACWDAVTPSSDLPTK